jgi:pyruvate/2-oxoglutarate/acetoin dehydrogenase E1 component
VPSGAAVRREGTHITCATYGAMTWTALDAAKELEKEGISLEVLDLRSLVPLDEEALLKSVSKTHRLMVLHEDSRRGGPGAEIAALVAEKALYDLEAPVVRVASPDEPVPYSPPLEWAHLPKASDVISAARTMMK